MNFPENNIIDTWLEKNGDPEVESFVKKNLAIIDKICSVLEERHISKSSFAKDYLKKSPSEFTKWISGEHNFTLKTIIKIEQALGINLVNIDPVTEYKYIYLGRIDPDKYEQAVNDYEESCVDRAI